MAKPICEVAGSECARQAKAGSLSDHLIGEGLEQIDLSINEWSHLDASDVNHAMASPAWIRGTVSEVRMPRPSALCLPSGVLLHFGLQIGNGDRSPVENGTCIKNATRQGQRTGDGIGPWWATRRSTSPSA